jgi:hypothetical protein
MVERVTDATLDLPSDITALNELKAEGATVFNALHEANGGVDTTPLISFGVSLFSDDTTGFWTPERYVASSRTGSSS